MHAQLPSFLVLKRTRAGTASAPYRSLPGPCGPGVLSVSGTISKESSEPHKKGCFETLESLFETVSDTFWAPGPEGPARLSRRLL